LLPTGRYAQSEAYIRRLAKPAFTIVVAQTAVIRIESHNPLMGRLYLLRKL
jgi:predicted TPR repeat methyltransferase